MKLLYICVAFICPLYLNVNGQEDYHAWMDDGFAKIDQMGCEFLGLVYCCFIWTGFTEAMQIGLVKRAVNLKKEAEDKGLSFDELVKKANKQIEEDVDDFGFGKLTNSLLGTNDLFKMIAEGKLTTVEEINPEANNVMFDSIQNSGLKRSKINEMIQKKCPNWRYKTDHSGMGMAISQDEWNPISRNGDLVDKSVAVGGEKGKALDCDALDFFYCCMTSTPDTTKYWDSSFTYSYQHLKQRAEKNGMSIKDLLSKAWKSFASDQSTISDMQEFLQVMTEDSKLTDQQIAKKLQVELQLREKGPWTSKPEIERLLKEKCFKSLPMN